MTYITILLAKHESQHILSNLVVYNASAGSGKTFTLAVEFIALCLQHRNPHHFRHVLAITFTNKAAHELKERVIQFTNDLGQGRAERHLIDELLNRLEIDEKELIERADRVHQAMLYQYSDLHVSTIDSFMLGILRSFSKELGLPFDFDVELDHERIMDMLIEGILSSIGQDQFITEQLVSWSTQNLDDDKGWNPKGNMKKALSHLFQEESIPFRKKLVELSEDKLKTELQRLQEKRQDLLRRIQEVQHSTRSLLNNSGLEPAYLNRGASGFISFAFKDFTVSTLPTDGHIEIVREGNLLSTQGKKAGVNTQAESIREQLLEGILRVRSWAEELKNLDGYYKNRMSLILALRLEKLIDHLEKEEGMSILQDNNAKVAKLIGENPAPFIYERVGERFKHFLIDEFQDTSVLQWRNMLPLIENSLSIAKKNFLVGDAKQSIYRWRGGEVDQLVEIPAIPDSDKDHRLKDIEDFLRQNFTESISLKKNFRSSRSVIEFNNALFLHLGISLSEKYRASYADADQHIIRGEQGYVCMTRLPDKAELDESLIILLEQIETCIDQGYSRSDVCILVRTNKEGRSIAKALEERGYNISSPDALLLSSHADVHLLISLLSHLSGTENYRHLLYAIYRLLERENRLSELVHWNQKLKSREVVMVVSDIMMSLGLQWDMSILQNKDPYSALVYLVDTLGINSKDAYIQELMNQASGFGSSREATLTGFIDYWEEKKNSLSVKAGVNPHSIQLMTIHRSKGLQFPVVIAPLINWKGSKKGKDKEWVELDNEVLSIGLININQSLENTALRASYIQEKEKSDLDKMNLLYVALTRAEDRLYVQVSDPGVNGLGQSLSDYVTKQGTNGRIVLGHESVCDPDLKIVTENAEIREFEKNKRDDLLSIALSKEDRKRAKRNFGETVHRILEFTQNGIDIPSAIELTMPVANYSAEERTKAKVAVSRAIALESTLGLNESKYFLGMEIDLLDKNGKAYRIDKLYLDEKVMRAVIIDYKTGERRDSDISQVQSYKDILDRMGYKDVSGYLIYTESKELLTV